MGKILAMITGNRPLIREGIRRSIEGNGNIEVLGETSLTEGAVSTLGGLAPGVAVMDVGSDGSQATEVARQLKSSWPTTVIVAIVERERSHQIPGLIESGVNGFVLDSARSEELVEIIHAARSGNLILDKKIPQDHLVVRGFVRSTVHRKGEVVDQLTRRETEVLKIIAFGMRNAEVAEKLGLSIQTIKGHLANAFSKLGARSRTEAIHIAAVRGLIELEENVIEIERPYSSETLIRGKESPSGYGSDRMSYDRSAHVPRAKISGDTSLSPGSPFRDLLNDVDEGCWLIQNEQVVFCNPAIARLLGCLQQELIGVPFVELLPSQLREPLLKLHRKRMAGGYVPERYFLTLRARDGTSLLVKASIKVIRHEGDKAVVAMLSDARLESARERNILRWNEISPR